MYFEAELQDIPGALIQILKPISDYKANITEIVHIRERRRENYIPVGFYISMETIEEFQSLISRLTDQGYKILTTRDLKSAFETTFILIGHVFEKGITEMIKEMFSISGTSVKDVHAKIRSVKEYSTVSFTVGTEKRKNMKKVVSAIENIARERKLYLIKPLMNI